MIEQLPKLHCLGDLRDIGAAALLGGLDGMGLQTRLLYAARVGELGHHRHEPRGAHLGGLFDDEIGAGLLDRGEEQPQVGRHLQRSHLLGATQHTAAFAGFCHLGAPFAVASVEQKHLRPDAKPHHAKEVMRLIAAQRNRLPLPQGLIYIQSDFRSHGARYMHNQPPSPDAPVADAVADNWVDRHAPRGLRPYLRLSRADRPIGTWLLLLPCWWGLSLAILFDQSPRWEDLWIFAGCGFGAFLMRGAGCTWNDITDRHIDGKVARTRLRPIPSGAVSVKQALAWMASVSYTHSDAADERSSSGVGGRRRSKKKNK